MSWSYSEYDCSGIGCSGFTVIIRALMVLSRLRPRHLPYLPLAVTLTLSDITCRLLGNRLWRSPRVRALDWGSGVSVVIPERGRVEMLAQCLAQLTGALEQITEPSEVIVVVNGCAIGDYAKLREMFPFIRWIHEEQPLGFTTAVLRGLGEARFGAVYLLNNDMLLERGALASLMPWRLPHIFAISSQIFFQEAGRRREETGWTFMTVANGMPCPRHEAPTNATVRGSVYAGAGSALYHADLLKQLLPGSRPFDPFYWEDTDVNVRAWRLGYEVLMCPASVAWHKHRATVARYYSAGEVERVFERNRWLFKLRNFCPPAGILDLLHDAKKLGRKTLGEIGTWTNCWRISSARIRTYLAPKMAATESERMAVERIRATASLQERLGRIIAYCEIDYAEMSAKSYLRPDAPSDRPMVVIVSPYGVIPPTHGGAIRILRLARALAQKMDIILLSDELDSYALEMQLVPWCDSFSSIHLVGNRPPEPKGKEGNRIARIRSHSHERLRAELVRLIETRKPQAVILEYMELGGLVDIKSTFRPPFILTLQDVLLQPDDPAQAEQDRYEQDLMDKFEGLVVTSKEDQVLLGDRESSLIPNGVDLPRSYVSSAGRRDILFVGPFRSLNNWLAIEAFLEQSFPRIQEAVSDAHITIIGGAGAKQRVAGVSCFSRHSIRVLEFVEDLDPVFVECALTINPQLEQRGSSLKVVQSLAAGRVCVTTRVGARGATTAGFKGLVVVDDFVEFSRVIIRLLLDEPYRLSIETPELAKLNEFSWEKAGFEFVEYVEKIIRRSPQATRRARRNRSCALL